MPEMLVRLKRGKKTYEVMVQEGLVPKYREGNLSISDVVLTPTVFTNASKGEKASADQLQSAFETDDVNAVIDQILRKGEAQESASERKDKMDAKRREIINAIHKGYQSPDGKPIPIPRIENALDTVRPRIDVEQDAERQIDAMSAKLAAVMPMKRAKSGMEGVISVPLHLSGAAASVIRKHARVHREAYGAQAKFEVEFSSQDVLVKELSKATGGDYDLSLSRPTVPNQAASPSAEASGSGGRGKKKKKGRK